MVKEKVLFLLGDCAIWFTALEAAIEKSSFCCAPSS